MSTDADGLTHIIPIDIHIARRGGRETRTVRIKCPFCSKLHTHGWGLGETTAPGARIAHCSNGRSLQYFIDLPPTVEVNE